MAISKVILNGETQMDVTPDTVTPEVMVEGYTALKNNGVRAVGTFVPNEGTVTEVATGTGLTGGPITSSGTIKADLVSETKLSNAATAATETAGRVYPVAVDKNGKLAVNVPWENSTYTPASATPLMDGTAAVGSSAKYAREDHVHPSDTSRVPTTRTVNGKALSSNITLAASDVSAIATSAKGAAGGVAELDSNGKVPTSQLPSFVDDVEEYLSKSSFPATGETGKIYVDTTTNLTYRWSGSAYVEISPSLALGTTSSTAFRGDYGNAAYTHAVTNKGSAFSSGLYKITTNSEGHVTAATAVAKSDITALGVPGSDTTYSAGTGLSLSSTTFNHSNSVTAGTAGTSSATSGSTLDVPYVTYDAQGHITATGTHTHTVSGFLTSHQTVKQDGITGATVNRYGTCTIAAGTAAKTVSITTGTFSLEAGAIVAVKFNNANTANSPTLNVGGTGAKNIFQNGAQITSGSNKELLKGVCVFIYDGTQYHLIGHYIDTNTTYTASTTSIGSASGWNAGSATTLGTAIAADDITSWDAGSIPSLSYTSRSVGSASGWSAGTAASASASEGVVTFTNGTAPSLTVTSVACDDITDWDAGSAPALSYTARSIPNVTSAGTAPSLTITSTTVATGITAS